MASSSSRVQAGIAGRTYWGSARYRVAVAGSFVLVLACFGGASRFDEPGQLAVRLSAILTLAATFWPLEFQALRDRGTILSFAAACLALPLIQLVPLPPDLWAALPGHGVYAQIARATGTEGWRPISLTPDLTTNALQALLAPLAVLVATFYLGSAERKWIAALFVLVAIASALLGIAQLAAGGDYLRLARESTPDAPVGLFANRNHQAALLACALPLAAAAFPRLSGDRRKAATAILLPAAAAVVVVLVLTGSRMGILLLLLAAVGAAWVLSGRGLLDLPRSRIARSTWLVAGIAIAAVAIAIFFQSGLADRFEVREIALDARRAALPYMLATAAAFFPLGSGFGSFDSVYRQFEPDALLSIVYLNQAHNEPLQLLIEGGLPALLLLGAFLFWWGAAARSIVTAKEESRRRGMARAALSVTALLMLSSIVDYPLRTPLLAGLFAFCCGEIAGLRHPRGDSAA